jgi:hypothetical protein
LRLDGKSDQLVLIAEQRFTDREQLAGLATLGSLSSMSLRRRSKTACFYRDPEMPPKPVFPGFPQHSYLSVNRRKDESHLDKLFWLVGYDLAAFERSRANSLGLDKVSAGAASSVPGLRESSLMILAERSSRWMVSGRK